MFCAEIKEILPNSTEQEMQNVAEMWKRCVHSSFLNMLHYSCKSLQPSDI